MKKNLIIRLSLILTVLLLVTAAFVGCGNDVAETTAETTENAEIRGTDDYAYNFTLKVVFEDGTEKSCPVVSNCETVGEALLDAGLIEGEESQYGLTVYTVCGVTYNFNEDSAYWALYVDGEYAMSGVDQIKCADVKEVEFRVEKF